MIEMSLTEDQIDDLSTWFYSMFAAFVPVMGAAIAAAVHGARYVS